MRVARSRNFTFAGTTSTIRLLVTLPSRTMASVDSVFKMSLVAVPAFRRVEPVRISGPTLGVMQISGRSARGIFRNGLKAMSTVVARRPRAPFNSPPPRGGPPHPRLPAPQKRLHHLRGGAEGPGTFARIQHAEPAAGASADVKQSSAVSERPHHGADGSLYRSAHGHERARNPRVLGPHQFHRGVK